MSKAMIAALKTAEVEDGVIRMSDQFRDMIVSELETLELLKGQESVEPILALDDGEHKLWQCGNCKVAVFTRGTKYCHNCGKGLKWDVAD